MNDAVDSVDRPSAHFVHIVHLVHLGHCDLSGGLHPDISSRITAMRSTWRLVVIMVLTLVSASLAAGGTGRALRVKVTYTGPGAIDAQHRIYISVFDTSYIGHEGVVPLATLSLTENGQSARFDGLKKSPVYVAAFYDKAGGYDPASDSPPSGSPAGLYGKQPGLADPIAIEEGKMAEIEMTFDETLTMP